MAVMLFCGAGSYASAQPQDIVVWMEDLGGDGWGDAVLKVLVYDGGPPNDTLFLALEDGEFDTYTFQVETGGFVVGLFVPATENNEEIAYRFMRWGMTIGGQGYGHGDNIIAFEVPYTAPYLSIRDCRGAIEMYGTLPANLTNVIQPAMSFINGDLDDLSPESQGCLAGEGNGHWLWITCNTLESDNSYLEFAMNGTNVEGDPVPMDFALWGPFAFADTGFCGQLEAPLRCSTAMAVGPTGLGQGAQDASEDVSGDGWLEPVPYVYGEKYVLFMMDLSGQPLAYSFDFDIVPSITTGTNVADAAATQQTAAVYLPTEQIVRLSANSTSGGTVAIHNSTGVLVKSTSTPMRLQEGSIEVGVSDLPAGVYVVQYHPAGTVPSRVARFVKY